MTDEIIISVIIPNLHSPMIDQTIKSILAQKTDFIYEIIVVGMDKWGLVKFHDPRVRFLETEIPTPPAKARNMGVAVSKGEIIFFIDADCIAAPDWIEQHLKTHDTQNELVVVGGGVTFPKEHFLTLADNVSSFHEFMPHLPQEKRAFLPSLNLSIPRKVWDTVGSFDPDYPFPAGEDTDLTMRIKKREIPLIFAPKAMIVHLPGRNSLETLFQHAYRFGRYSIKANPAYWDELYIPFPLKYWILTILFSPLLAAGVIIKIIYKEKLPLEYWHTLPVVYLQKIAWSFGFARRIVNRESE